MPESERQLGQPKNDFSRELRSSSPAIKRPASVMGAQEREEHNTDTEMGEEKDPGFTSINAHTQNGADIKAKQQDTGERHREESSSESLPHTSDTRAFSQQVSTDDSASTGTDSFLQSNGRNSTAATSINAESSIPAAELPSVDEQVRKVTELASRETHEKQKGYLVSSKWLRRVQARMTSPPENAASDKAAAEGPVGPVDNVDIAMVMEDSGKLLDEAGDPYVPLRPGTSEGEDFQILPEDAWDLIVKWYGLAKESPIITRYAHNISENEGSAAQFEINPPIFNFLKVTSNHTLENQREKELLPVRMLASRSTPFMKWLKQAKELTHIPINNKVRIWKINGGLKNMSGSGILTPIASRSSSPAPGVEIVANAGDHMLLDVRTFAALDLDTERELCDADDQTANAKYNGSKTLSMVNLTRDGEVIVLEEELTTSKGGWPSDNLKLSIGVGKGLQNKIKGLTVPTTLSGRSSPVAGMMTRGRQKRDGRPKGISGLTNLGNTCYMNSALQCIRSVEELTQYFLHDEWKTELNVDNPLGNHGEVAKAYAGLMKQIYEESTSGSTNPGKFKTTIGRFNPSFGGYQQQDTQEFLVYLLDGLQEDLNRIMKKPYIEKPDSTDEMVHDHSALKAFANKNWEIYKARNDSVITDLFAGMYKSTLTCPVCEKVSIIFDPFTNLTLQLPIENTWNKDIYYFPLHQRPIRIDVDIDKHSSMKNLKEFIAKRTDSEPNRLIVSESYKHRFYKIFDNNISISEANIQAADTICVYELDSVPTNYNPDKKKKFSLYSMRESDDELVDVNSPGADRLLVPVYNRIVKNPDTKRPYFGEPTYIIITREDAKSYDRVLKKLLGNVARMTTNDILNIGDSDDSGNGDEDSDTVVMADDGSNFGSKIPRAESVQGEDELVDVSMRDASQAPESASLSDANLHPVLRPGTHIPPQLKKMFRLSVGSSGEGIPTGWTQFDENKVYESVKARVPKATSRRSPTSSDSVEGGSEESSTTSDEELQDIPHDESVQAQADLASESGNSVPLTSPPDSEPDELPEIRDLIPSKSRNPRGKITYSKKDRRQLNKATKQRRGLKPQRRTPPPQPQPRPQPVDTEALIRPGEAIILDWDFQAYEALFGGDEGKTDEMRGAPTWTKVDTLPDEELAAKRAKRNSRKKNGVTLEDCLNEIGKPETLSEDNAWYCPRCKEHRRAEKRFELWKCPDILIMHLKRFASARSWRDKLEVKVDYPVEGLELTKMVLDPEEGKPLIYDLIAVDMHFGGLGGGHYTAYTKNFFTSGWTEYNGEFLC